MRIAIVSRGDRLIGGASRGAYELARWLIEEGHSVTHFCWEFKQAPESFQKQLGGGRVTRKATHKLHSLATDMGFPQLLPFEYYLHLRWVRESFDLFHFHDLINAISYETMIALSRHKPVVFTAHDCSAFTGGCVYPEGCENYKKQCGQCPQLGIWPMVTKYDYTGYMQKLRRRAASQPNIQYVFPSEWIAREMIEVMPLARPAAQITNSIDPTQITATEKSEAREKLGLPLDRPVILFSAHYLSSTRKGASYAIETIQKVADLNPVLITLGFPDPALEAKLGGISMTSFGYVSEPEKMALIYSAADVYLFTSVADNCPYTVLEAMAAGTATVGFATGGVPELVTSEKEGLLVPMRDSVMLAAALRRALLDKALTQQWGRQARVRIENDFNKKRFMEKMTALYEEFVQDMKSRS